MEIQILFVSVSGFVRVCVDEDGNEKRVSSFQLTKERSGMSIWGAFSPLVPLSILAPFSLLPLCPACLVCVGGVISTFTSCVLHPCCLGPCPRPSLCVLREGQLPS